MEEERARIARELHDIVSHSLSVITIQIQAVRRRLGSLETNEVEALEAIEATARQAMDEMRRLLGVLRAQREPPALAPQPSFHQLHDLVEEARAAGLQVRLEVVGDSVALSPGISLTAYRVVQEALTNVRKHAGATRAEVSVRYLPRSLEIRVDDTGGRRSTPPRTERSHERGYGLAGMRERVTLYGGTLDAGPRPEGGFHILVSLPLAAAESVMA